MNGASTTVCDDLEHLAKGIEDPSVKLGWLLRSLRLRGFAMLMMLFVLPNCVPIPVPPGTSTVLSLPLFYIAGQMLFGFKEPWFPSFLHEKHIDAKFLKSLILRVSLSLRRFESMAKPRLLFMSSRSGEILLGAFWLAFTLSVAIPLPGTNFVPGVGILVSAFGFLNRDGLIVLLGTAIGFVGLVITASIFLMDGGIIYLIWS